MRIETINKIRYYVNVTGGFIFFANLFVFYLFFLVPEHISEQGIKIVSRIALSALVIVVVPVLAVRVYDLLNTRYGLLAEAGLAPAFKYILTIFFTAIILLAVWFAYGMLFNVIPSIF